MSLAAASAVEGHPRFLGRQYTSSLYNSRMPYLPLGPRFEHRPLYGKVPDGPRSHVWNFIGSLNTDQLGGSGSRGSLKSALTSWVPFGNDTMLHVARDWVEQPSAANGRVGPAAYQAVLLESYYTLCPRGHNLETFRFWEAVDAGSIPIMVLQRRLAEPAAARPRQLCLEPLSRVLATNPPIIIMPNWTAAVAFLERRRRNPRLAMLATAERRKLRAWSNRYWRGVALQIDLVLMRGAVHPQTVARTAVAPTSSTRRRAASRPAQCVEWRRCVDPMRNGLALSAIATPCCLAAHAVATPVLVARS